MATVKEVSAREARAAEVRAQENARAMAERGDKYRPLSSWEGSVWNKAVESLLLSVKDGGYGLYPLSPIFSMLMPYVDITAETAYTDVRARVGVGLAFFYEWDDRLRAFALAHEALHVANRHFQRADEVGKTFESAHRMMNVAGDMEINDLLRNMKVARREDEGTFVFPESMGYERAHTMEEYLVALHGDMEKLQEMARQLEETQAGSGGGFGQGDSGSGDNGQSGEGNSGDGGSGNDGQSGESGNGGSDGGESGSSGNSGDSENASDGGSGRESGNAGGGASGSGDGNEGGSEASGSEGSGAQGGSSSGDSGGSESGRGGKSGGGWTSQYVKQNVAHACGSRSDSDDDREGERITAETGVRGRELADVESARQDAEALVRDAAEGNANIGDGEGNVWVRLLAGMAPPRVHWQTVLAGVVGRSMSSRVRGNRYATYRRPNRRRQGGPFVWPTREDNRPTVHVAVDTSGSMGRGDYAHAVAEIEAILRTSASGARVGFYGVDTRMTEKPRMVSHVRDMKALGGGGTDMAVPYEWMRGEWEAGGKRRREMPDVHVLVTDGWVAWGETLAAAATCKSFTRMVIVVTDAQEDKRIVDAGRAAGVSVVYVNG